MPKSLIKHFGLLLVVILATEVYGENAREAVEIRFGEFLQAKAEFSETVIDFYSDDAAIDHFEQVNPQFLKENHLTGKQYKHILNKIRLLAKANNDEWDFSDLEFNAIGTEVHVKGTRFSHLRNYTVPYESHWAKDANGDWKIVYEYLKSIPIPENL